MTQRLERGVEGPRRRLSYPCCWELFNHRARTGFSAQPPENQELTNSCCPPLGKNRSAGAPGFGGRKAPNSMGNISAAEVLRLRATKRCITRSIGEALRSEPVTFLVHGAE